MLPLLTAGAAVAVVAVVALAAVHVGVAAVGARFFRVHLDTQWGAALYTLLAVPLVYVVTTLLVFGALGVGDAVTLSREALLLFVWALPLALGLSIDLFWMPAPEEVDLPARS